MSRYGRQMSVRRVRALVVVFVGTVSSVAATPEAVVAAPSPVSSRCAPRLEQLPATSGYASGFEDPDENGDDTTPRNVGRPTGLARRGLRVVTRRSSSGRIVTATVCDDAKPVAAVPGATGRSRVVGLSASGSFIALRVWQPGRRGLLVVGEKRRSRLIGVRRTGVPTSTHRASESGRIAVSDAGDAAWMAREGRRLGVWLWPRTQTPQRLLRISRSATTRARDLRIIDATHLQVGGARTFLRHGRPTPGRCPSPQGAFPRTVGSATVTSLSLVEYPEHAFASDYVGTTVVCDRTIGDYTAVETTNGFGTLHDYGQSNVYFAARTAGTTVLQEASSSSSPQARSYTTAVNPAGRPNVLSYAPGIALGAPDTAPAQTTSTPDPPAPKITARLIPGAVAWFGAPVPQTGRGTATIDVWLADSRGARVLDTIPTGALYGLDPAHLELNADTVTWTGTGGVRTASVTPVPNDPVESAVLRAPDISY